MSYIYKITNDINNKVYIGQTSFSIEKRFSEHCKDAFKFKAEKRPLYSAMRKYGIENFHVELLEETENPNEREKYWIQKFNTYHNGYNATIGGEGKCLYDHSAIAKRIQEYPYASEVAQEFGCCVDIVYAIAHKFNISLKNKAVENISNKKKSISAYTKNNEFIQNFNSTVEAAKWCFDT